MGSSVEEIGSAKDFIPQTRSLKVLREAVQHCRGCSLYQSATQAVFGAGPVRSRLFLIGEQPGDREDLEGEPFVGPAGRLLDECLAAAEIPRKEVYLTNAVKHFKFEPHGKRRLHKKPGSREVSACRPWLERELEIVRPEVLICLGASAAQSLLGSGIRVTRQHGDRLESPWCRNTMVTYHPSAALRAPKESARHEMKATLIADLKIAAGWLKEA